MGVIFLTVFMDLAGFSIIFPLFPAMLNFYLPREGSDSILGHLIHGLKVLTETHTESTLASLSLAVLFGGILGSLYSLLQFFFSPIWGHLSDKMGRRPILLTTVGGIAISYLIWIFSGSFLLLIISRVIGGIMSGNISVATAAIADVTTPEKRTRGMAVIGIAFGLGFLVGPAIGGFTATIDLTRSHPELIKWGINPFSVPATLAFILSVINLIWIFNRFGETIRTDSLDNIHKDQVEKVNRDLSRELSPWARIRNLFITRNIAIKKALVIYFLFIFAFSGLEFSLTFLALERLNYGPLENVRIFVYVGLVMLLIQGYLVRKYGSRIGEKKLNTVGLICAIVGFLLLAVSHGQILFYMGLTAMGIAAGLITPALSSLISLLSGKADQGIHLGQMRAGGALGRALGPIAASVTYWYLGSHLAYPLGAALLLIPFFQGLSLIQPGKQEQSESSP